ncbi:MAG: autotransporter outer membrane beta-barrel domain-containing protein [Betaproteobacteria bacterium]|nr:autotransporter outer membrane beta-barrel domain-containing protein [Betaproteobacteria bacterium]
MRRTLLATSLASCFSLVAPGALAADVTVADGDTLTSPLVDTNWVFGGNAKIDSTITMPTQTGAADALTITSASPGPSTITLVSPLTSTSHAFSSTNSSMWIHTVGDVVFDGTGAPNTTPDNGSLIFNDGATVANGSIYLGTTGGNVTVTNFVTNGTADPAIGGAIYSSHGVIEIGGTDGIVTLSNNTTNSVAAAVYTADNGDRDDQTISIYGKTITIEDNTAALHSGAIYTRGGDITIGTASTETVQILGNTAQGSGGAIQAAGNKVTIKGQSIELVNNHAEDTKGASSGSGGAIMGSMGVDIGDANSTVTISNNSSVARGGAIFASNRTMNLGTVVINGSQITLSNNSAGNIADPSLYDGFIGGGAIYANTDIELNGGAITLTGNEAKEGSGGALEAEGNITITGSMEARGNTATGTATTTTMTTSGNGGVIWSGHDVTLKATTGNIGFFDNQAGGDGGAIRAGGDVTLEATAGNITFQGNTAGEGGAAIWFQNSYGNVPSDATATFNAASGRTISFSDSIANNAANGLLTVNKTGAGAVVFNSANATSPIYGTTTVQGGAFVVRNGAVYGNLLADVPANFGATNPTSFTVNSGATLAGGGNSGVRADQFSLQGTLDISGSSLSLPGHPAAGNASGGYSTFTLTTGSQTQFASGSTILFNTYLNDGSAQLTDKLVLDLNGGATTGTATISVNNTGGAGELTTGDGIMLVETQNGTSANAFALPAPVVAGPYEYTLHHGNNGNQSQNWYLRSTLDCTQPQNANICSGGGGEDPEIPGGGGEDPGIPDYRDETSTYTVLPSMALLYGLNVLDTLHERVGDEEDIRGRSDLHQSSPDTGGWGRLIGTHGRQKGGALGIYEDKPKYDYNFLGFQVGHDLRRVEKSDGTRDHMGIYFAYGHANGKVTHIVNNNRGTNKFHAYTLGGYWTHFAKTGWYADSVLQGTYYNMSSTSAEKMEMSTNATAIALSIEGGKTFRFDKGYFIEPQAQLIYQTVDMDSTTDAGGKVTFSSVDSFVGRVGARFGRTWPVEEERKMTFWIRPNIWHEFRGKPVTKFDSADGPVPFRADLDGTWGELNIGGSRQTSRNVSLYLNASYDHRFNSKGYAYSGKFGVRVNW